MHSRISIKKLIIFTITFVNIFCFDVIAYGLTNLGVVGVTYKIAEPDALLEIQKKVKSIDINRLIDRNKLKREIEYFRPSDTKILPMATKNRTYKVDMTYILKYDISDKDGHVIYPAGYTFNPLDYMNYPGVIVIIDAARKKELEWFKKSKYYKDVRILFLITDGYPVKLSEELNRPVYFATGRIINRLQVKHTPCVIKQKGRYLEVREYAVQDD